MNPAQPGAGKENPPPRVVLDTNVCLDLFVYRDSHCTSLMTALQAGVIEAVTNEACRDEWLRVLHYPQFGIDDDQRQRVTAAFDAQIRLLDRAALRSLDQASLPLCSDADDQKFLQLAWAAQAAWLVTKDKALLKLARRTRKAGMFAIGTPYAWASACAVKPL